MGMGMRVVTVVVVRVVRLRTSLWILALRLRGMCSTRSECRQVAKCGDKKQGEKDKVREQGKAEMEIARTVASGYFGRGRACDGRTSAVCLTAEGGRATICSGERIWRARKSALETRRPA